MARQQYSFTFTNAQQGAAVHLSTPTLGQVDVYATADEGRPNDDDLVLDADNTVTVWADPDELVDGELIAETVDGRGTPLRLTATTAAPTQTSNEGFAGTFVPDPTGGSMSWAHLTAVLDATDGATHSGIPFAVTASDGSGAFGASAGHITFGFTGLVQMALRPDEDDTAATAPTVWPRFDVSDASAALWAAGFIAVDTLTWRYPEGARAQVIIPPFHVTEGDWIELAINQASAFTGCKAWLIGLPFA